MVNKNILLTGGTGFLGGFLLEELINQGFTIILLKRSYSDVSKISGFLDKVKCYDIDTLDTLEMIFKENIVDIIIHTATDYGRRDGNFYKIVESNLLLPIKLLELGIQYGISGFMNTDTFWDEKIQLPIGLSYYSYSKKDFIKYAKRLIENKDVCLINVKLEHLYGPRDRDDKFIPYIIKNFLKNVDSLDLTEGGQKKDFIYVKDAVDAYMHILNNIGEQNHTFEEFDLGTGKTLSIKDLVIKVHDALRCDTVLNFGKLMYRDGESMDSKADIKKLNKLGWEPKYTIDIGLSETINYFKENNI